MRLNILSIWIKFLIASTFVVWSSAYAQIATLPSAKGHYLIYPHINNMIQRLDQSCSKSDLQNNYSYELLKKYKNKKVVADYSEFMMMNQISWLRGKVAVACDIALARNTLEGMRFIQATRPLSSFSHRNTDLSIATALAVLWFYDRNVIESDLAPIKDSLDKYVAENNSAATPDLDQKLMQEKSMLFNKDMYFSFASNAFEGIFSNYAYDENQGVLLNDGSSKIIPLLRLALSYRLQGNKLHEDLNSTTQFQVALARLLKTNSDEQTQMLNAINQYVQGVDSLRATELAEIFAQRGDLAGMQKFVLLYQVVNQKEKQQLNEFYSDLARTKAVKGVNQKEIQQLKKTIDMSAEIEIFRECELLDKLLSYPQINSDGQLWLKSTLRCAN